MTIEPILQDLPSEEFDQGRSGDLLRRYEDLYGPEIPMDEYQDLYDYAEDESAYFDFMTDEEIQADTEEFLAHLPDTRIDKAMEAAGYQRSKNSYLDDYEFTDGLGSNLHFENASDALGWLHNPDFATVDKRRVALYTEPRSFDNHGSFHDAEGTWYDIRYEDPNAITVCTMDATGKDSDAVVFDNPKNAFVDMVDFVEHTRAGDIIWHDEDTKQRYNEERFEHVKTSISDGRDNAQDELEQREKN